MTIILQQFTFQPLLRVNIHAADEVPVSFHAGQKLPVISILFELCKLSFDLYKENGAGRN